MSSFYSSSSSSDASSSSSTTTTTTISPYEADTAAAAAAAATISQPPSTIVAVAEAESKAALASETSRALKKVSHILGKLQSKGEESRGGGGGERNIFLATFNRNVYQFVRSTAIFLFPNFQPLQKFFYRTLLPLYFNDELPVGDEGAIIEALKTMQDADEFPNDEAIQDKFDAIVLDGDRMYKMYGEFFHKCRPLIRSRDPSIIDVASTMQVRSILSEMYMPVLWPCIAEGEEYQQHRDGFWSHLEEIEKSVILVRSTGDAAGAVQSTALNVAKKMMEDGIIDPNNPEGMDPAGIGAHLLKLTSESNVFDDIKRLFEAKMESDDNGEQLVNMIESMGLNPSTFLGGVMSAGDGEDAGEEEGEDAGEEEEESSATAAAVGAAENGNDTKNKGKKKQQKVFDDNAAFPDMDNLTDDQLNQMKNIMGSFGVSLPNDMDLGKLFGVCSAATKDNGGGGEKSSNNKKSKNKKKK